MNTHQKRKKSLCRQILRHQGELISQYPRILISPIVEALICWGLLLLVAHPFIHHYEQGKSLGTPLSANATSKMLILLITYFCFKHLIRAFSVSTTILQIKSVISQHTKPLNTLTALYQSTAHWKSITSWVLFLTFFSNLSRLLKPLLNKWEYLNRFMSGSDHLATSMLILPCLLSEKITAREAYRKMGKSIQNTWGNSRKLNLDFVALGAGLIGITIIPIATYYLLGLHGKTSLAICITLSILISIIVRISSSLTTSITLTHLHHYATTQQRAQSDVEIERALVEFTKHNHHGGAKSRHPDELKLNAA